MGELAETVQETVEEAGTSRLNTAVAVLVSVAATFLAISNVKDDNVTQAMAAAQARSIDAWSFYQAKSMKQHLAQSLVDQLSIQRQLSGNLQPADQALLDAKIAEFSAQVKKYEAEKATIRAEAQGHQAEYDRLNKIDDQFDMCEALLSVALALFGIAALVKRNGVLGLAFGMLCLGTLFGVAGFAGWSLRWEWLARLLS